ncbi:MAG: DUF3072 domain-containing protein [Rubrivivax sp.]|nr:DUF3072 domain-containing protein [Rubrivivax sp.]
MTDKQLQDQAETSNMKKDPADWVTGDEPMTGAQKSYLKTLSEEAHEPFDEALSKGAASSRIEELQASTGRKPPQQVAQQSAEQSAQQSAQQPAAEERQPPSRSAGAKSTSTAKGNRA